MDELDQMARDLMARYPETRQGMSLDDWFVEHCDSLPVCARNEAMAILAAYDA